MSPARMVLLAVGTVIFAVWTVLMFRTLFELRRRGAAQSGQVFPGPAEALRQWGAWLRNPADRADRQRLGWTTLALFAWSALNATVAV